MAVASARAEESRASSVADPQVLRPVSQEGARSRTGTPEEVARVSASPWQRAQGSGEASSLWVGRGLASCVWNVTLHGALTGGTGKVRCHLACLVRTSVSFPLDVLLGMLVE